MTNQPEIIAIGDVVVDAFIELLPKEAEIDQSPKDHHPLLCMTYGSKLPFKDVTIISGVGNSPNAAVSFARLGLRTGLASNIGSDSYGHDILMAMKNEKVSTEFIHINRGKKTNYHYVLWYKDDRTILIKHEKYHYTLPKMSGHKKPRWLYLSSLGENSLEFHQQLAGFLKSNPEVKLAFQPGTFQMKFGTKALAGIYGRTELFFCNKEEAQLITGIGQADIRKLTGALHRLGPKVVCITDGPHGSYASDGTNLWSMRNYPDPKPPFERTGAGDAYSSTFTAAIAMGESVETAMRWAPINSMNVVQNIGAQAGLLRKSALLDLLAHAPVDYRPQEIK